MQKRSWRLVLLAALLVLLTGLLGGRHLWARRHYRAALRSLELRDFAGAEQHFSQCLKIWPQSTAMHLEAARAARKAGQLDETERLLHRCRELGGDADAIHLEHQLVGVQRGRLADVESQLVARVLQKHPESVGILEVLTLAYVQNYQLVKAQECLKRWLEREPNRAEAWLLRAYVFERLKNSSEVLTSYKRAFELDPDDDDTRLQIAGHLAEANHVEEAMAHFEHLQRKQGDTPAILKGMACCRRLLNQPEEARRLLEAVLTENPRDWRALAERGRLALQFESAADAEKWLRQAVAVAPYESAVNYSLCQCLARLGKHQEAEELQAKFKRIEDDLAQMADQARAIALKPHDPALRCRAGIILLHNGMESEGLRWLESALAEDPLHAATHQAIAEYYERAGNSERAEQHRQLARTAGAPLAGASGKASPDSRR